MGNCMQAANEKWQHKDVFVKENGLGNVYIGRNVLQNWIWFVTLDLNFQAHVHNAITTMILEHYDTTEIVYWARSLKSIWT